MRNLINQKYAISIREKLYKDLTGNVILLKLTDYKAFKEWNKNLQITNDRN